MKENKMSQPHYFPVKLPDHQLLFPHLLAWVSLSSSCASVAVQEASKAYLPGADDTRF